MGEAEALQELGGREIAAVDAEARPGAGQHLADAVGADLGELAELLVEDAGADGAAPPHASARRRDRPGDEAEQGGLAGAVRPEDARALPGADVPRDLAQHLVPVEAHAGVLEVDDVPAQAGDGQALQLQRVAHRRDVGDELVGGLDAEPRLGRAGRGAAAQPGQFLAHEVLPPGLGGGRDAVALDAGQHIGRVAALEGLDGAVVHLPGGGADLVEEPAVVGDDEQAA